MQITRTSLEIDGKAILIKDERCFLSLIICDVISTLRLIRIKEQQKHDLRHKGADIWAQEHKGTET